MSDRSIELLERAPRRRAFVVSGGRVYKARPVT
jgi:hypothetical protein